MKKLLFILLTIIITNHSYAEKWVGKAATYQKKKGSITAAGQVFESEGYYAASNGFRLGAEITIKNVNSNKEIKVVVNDRIDEKVDYFVLLTPKAARDLELEWQTGIVIVDANFDDINSIDKLDINGLVAEGEIDTETLKKFPDIKISMDKGDEKNGDKTLTDKPTIESINKPVLEEKKVILDYDEKNGIKYKEGEEFKPEKESLLNPELISKTEKLDSDEQKIAIKEIITDVKPETDKKEIPLEDEKKIAMDTDINLGKTEKVDTKVITESIETVDWNNKLIAGKIYIRFSTTFDKDEGERRVLLFKKIFSNTVWIREKNKYILYLGPVETGDIESQLEIIRSYGFKDAYLVTGK